MDFATRVIECALFLFYRDARPVSHMLACSGNGIEYGGFSRIRVSCQGQGHFMGRGLVMHSVQQLERRIWQRDARHTTPQRILCHA